MMQLQVQTRLRLSGLQKRKVRSSLTTHNHSPVTLHFSPTGRRFPPSVFHLVPSFWRVGTTQQKELLHPYGTEQPALPGDFLAFGPKSHVAQVAWHEATLLLARIPVSARPRCFDFQRQGGLCELKHRCPSPSHTESVPMALGLRRLVLKGRVYSAGNSSLLNLKSNFQLNELVEEVVWTLSLQFKSLSLQFSLKQALVSATFKVNRSNPMG